MDRAAFPDRNLHFGIAMIEKRPILGPDIRADPRVPIAAYAPTFERALAMFASGLPEPARALGVYSAKRHEIDANAFMLLAGLARSAGSRSPGSPRRAEPSPGRAGPVLPAARA